MNKAVEVPMLLGRVLRITAKALPTLAIIAYFSGWQYINQYFSEFNINRSSFSFNEYTIFIYLFSVVAKIPSMVATFNIQIVKSTLALVALVAGPFVAPKLPKAIPRFLLLRLWVWLWLILALFWISQEAGRIDARKVFDKQARGVNIFFADAFKKDLAANENKHWAEQRIAEIRKASELGAVALIWRSSEESILLMFGTSGELKGVPIEILRINNSYIVSIFTKISSKPKR